MRLHDFFDDRKPEPGAGAARLPATPEAVEQMRPILEARAPATIGDADAAVRRELHSHLRVRRCKCNRILEQVAQRVLDRVPVPSNMNRVISADKRDGTLLRNRNRRDVFDDVGCSPRKIQILGDVECHTVETRHTQQLIDQPIHARNVLPQLCEIAVAFDAIEFCRDDRERRPELVRRIRGEPALHDETVLESVKRPVHSPDQRDDLGGQVIGRQPHRYRTRIDYGGLGR